MYFYALLYGRRLVGYLAISGFTALALALAWNRPQVKSKKIIFVLIYAACNVLHDQVPGTEIVAYIDQRGQKIVSSDEREFPALFNGNESLKSNLGFMNGIAGKSGYSIETINGIEMFVVLFANARTFYELGSIIFRTL